MASAQRFGLSCAVLTPFTEALAPDVPALVAHVRRILSEGADSVTLFGTTGEGPSIATSERAAIVKALVDAGLDPRRQMVMGVTAPSLPEAVDQAQLGLQAGARALLVAPPYFFKGVSDEGVFAWYAAFFAALGSAARDVVLYHIPQATGVPLSVDVIGRLKTAFPHIVLGVKDSAGQFGQTRALLAAHRDLAIMIGQESQLAEAVRLGAQGTICGYANLIARSLRSVVDEGREHPDVARMDRVIEGHPFISAFKALVGHVHGGPGWRALRPPLAPLSTAQHAEVIGRYEQQFRAAAA